MKSLRFRLLVRITLAILAVELAMLVVSVGFRYYELREMGYTQVTPGRMTPPPGYGGHVLAPQVNLAAYAVRIAVALALVILGSIVILYVSLNDVILGPVRRIIDANEAAVNGDEDAGRMDPDGMLDEEWRRIVASRERMLDRLHAARAELEEANDRLEAKVRERTQRLHETSAELVQAEKLATLGAVSASFAHELSHPLTAVFFEVAAALREADGAPQGERLRAIQSHLSTIQGMVDNFRSYSRKPDAVRRIDLNGAVRRACDILQHQLENQSVVLELELDAAVPPVRAEETLVQQVAVNLIANARDAVMESHGRNGGRVRVRTRVDLGGVILAVEDNGPGIAAEDRERIFEPFYTTKPASIGTGLGLPIIRTIMENLDGEIRVRSTPGAGAVFEAVFRAAGPPAPRDGAETADKEPDKK